MVLVWFARWHVIRCKHYIIRFFAPPSIIGREGSFPRESFLRFIFF